MAKGRKSGAASALFNMMRNNGGSIGMAGLSTLLFIRVWFQPERIGESVIVWWVPCGNECSSQQITFFLRVVIRIQPKCAKTALLERKVFRDGSRNGGCGWIRMFRLSIRTIYRIADGKIVENWYQPDSLSLAE
jgi:hypothetical protein